MVRAVAFTSISPVFILGFTLAPRLTTVPWTPMHHSRRSVPARAWASGSMSGSKTTWVRPCAVAEVDEHGAAVVAAVLDPAEEDHGLADVLGGELATGMGALDLGDEGNGHGGAAT